jgi:FKBP-type peptidyl-prolyl cis-trans isomerase 2
MCPVALTDTVTIAYTAALENGEIIEQSDKDKPVTLSIGGGTLFKAVEACLFGMEPGDTRQINVQPEDAFGLHLDELVQKINKKTFPESFDPKPGMIVSLNLQREDGTHSVPATVVAADDDSVTVDYNHPLAGQIIVYTVTLVAINT